MKSSIYLKKRILKGMLPLLLGTVLWTGCGPAGADIPSSPSESTAVHSNLGDLGEPITEVTPTPSPTPAPTPEPTPTPPPEATLMALGDNLMHMGIVNTGLQSDKTYNYDFLFEDISDLIQAADIRVINQETIFGGNELGFSGYPYFNSPTEVGDAIVKAGFNVVLQATNHTCDQKLAGMENCIAYWKEHPEVLMAGLHDRYEPGPDETPEEIAAAEQMQRIHLITVNDITFAILNYTYGPNAETLASFARGRLDVLSNWNPSNGSIDFTTIHPSVLEDIAKAEELADIVIVFPHWGVEYATTPSKYQQTFAKQMAQAGADVIIGAHPHVTQPVEWITADNGNECLCYYSLGNYVSTQKDPISMLENMAWVSFIGTDDGVIINKEKTGSIPLVFQYAAGPLRFKGVYLLEEYTQELADVHGIRSWGPKPIYVDQLQQWADEIMGESIKSVYDLTGLRGKNE